MPQVAAKEERRVLHVRERRFERRDGVPERRAASTRYAVWQNRVTPLVVVFAAVPLLEELVKEVRVSLSLGIGLIASVDLGD